MKPLLVASLTSTDDRIMQGIRARWRYPLNHWYQYYDRRDADLMWRLSTYMRPGHPPVIHVALGVDPDLVLDDIREFP